MHEQFRGNAVEMRARIGNDPSRAWRSKWAHSDHQNLLRCVVVPRLEGHTAITITKRGNKSSGMILSADSTIDSMIHEKARCRATTVPEAGRVLLWRVTVRKSGGENLRHFMRPRQAFASDSQTATADGISM